MRGGVGIIISIKLFILKFSLCQLLCYFLLYQSSLLYGICVLRLKITRNIWHEICLANKSKILLIESSLLLNIAEHETISAN